MSTEIKSLGPSMNVAPLQLISKLEGHQDVVNAAAIIANEDGVISISEDKTIRIWLKRDRGTYWPSVCHVLSAPASTMDYNQQTKRLFVGLDSGQITEFSVSSDFNRIKQVKEYTPHQGRTQQVLFSLECEWLLSIGRDKFLQWHCTERGHRVGQYFCKASCTALQFDHESRHVFIGDASGGIEMLKLENNLYKPITTLSGHGASIRCLTWDGLNQLLFSGSHDKVIICWDIGTKKGTAYELAGHRSVVTSLHFLVASKQLVSTSEDCIIMIWDIHSNRLETPEWAVSDFCQRCNRPFFWNLKAMYDQKSLGYRQHHCRRCGKAICDACSVHRSTLPKMGYEYQVRVCNDCFTNITDADRVSLAKFYDSKHCINDMNIDETNKLMVTCGFDRVIKLWDMTDSS